MNLGKYIYKLLLENETVIIPGFGAFISNYKSAEINPDSNELKPPSKEISFSQQIRNNDGLLVGSVALGEGVSHFDALKLIEKERENIIYQLDKGEKISIEQTGELFTNDKHEILLNPFVNENLLLDSFGLETIALEDHIQNNDEIVEIVPVPVPEGKEKPEEIKAVEVEKPKNESPAPEPAPIKLQELIPEKDESKKRGWLWLLLILIPIIIVGIFIVNKNSKVENVPIEKAAENKVELEEKPVSTIDTIVKDTTSILTVDSTDVEETFPVPVEIPEVESPKFYLVGGSFKKEENAENYLIELKTKGLEPFHLGKRGNFYIVAIGTYQTEKEAVLAKQQFYAGNPKSGVWIMEEK